MYVSLLKTARLSIATKSLKTAVVFYNQETGSCLRPSQVIDPFNSALSAIPAQLDMARIEYKYNEW